MEKYRDLNFLFPVFPMVYKIIRASLAALNNVHKVGANSFAR